MIPSFPQGINATGVVTATTFKGGLTGNVTGDVTGDIIYLRAPRYTKNTIISVARYYGIHEFGTGT